MSTLCWLFPKALPYDHGTKACLVVQLYPLKPNLQRWCAQRTAENSRTPSSQRSPPWRNLSLYYSCSRHAIPLQVEVYRLARSVLQQEVQWTETNNAQNNRFGHGDLLGFDYIKPTPARVVSMFVNQKSVYFSVLKLISKFYYWLIMHWMF